MTSINSYAFYGCTGINGSIDLSNQTLINEYTFYGCTGINELKNTESLATIKQYGFYGCTGIRELNNLNKLTNIEQYAFYGCSGIAGSVDLKAITAIAQYAFMNCTGINELIISDTANSLANNTFTNCTGLTKLKIPCSLNSVVDTSTGWSAFSGVVNLKEITYSKGNGTGYNYSRSECTSTPWYYSRANELTVTFEEGIDDIGTNTFKDCIGITYVNIPKSLTKIRKAAFSGCTQIRKVNYASSMLQWQTIQFEEENDDIKNRTTVGVLNNNNGIADTGINLTSGNYKIETQIKNVSYSNSYNYIYGTGKNNFETYIDAQNKQLHFTNNNVSLNSNLSMKQNQVYTIIQEVKDGTMKAIVDGEEWITGSTTGEENSSGNLKLFASSANNYTTNMVIYYFKLYKDDTLVLDLEPVVRGALYEGKKAESNGFYDKVQKKFIYSSNEEFGLEGGIIVYNEE